MPLQSLLDLQCPLTPLTPPRSLSMPLMLLIPLLAPEGIHFLPSPNAPPTSPLTPLTPLTPLLVEASSGQQ